MTCIESDLHPVPHVSPEVADVAPGPGDHPAHPQGQAGLHTLAQAPGH